MWGEWWWDLEYLRTDVMRMANDDADMMYHMYIANISSWWNEVWSG